MKSEARFAPLLCAALLAASLSTASAMGQKGEEPNDSWITLKTKTALLTSGGVNGMDIHVDALRGRVTLFGRVDTQAERARAEEITRGVSGVSQVRNLLQIARNPTAEAMVKRSDQEIHKQLDASLSADPGLVVAPSQKARVERKDDQLDTSLNKSYREHDRLKGVNVEVKNGVERLTGNVATELDVLDATVLARGTIGVRSVRSELTVKPVS